MVKHETPLLFSPLQLRDLTLRNRIAVSPMCQYSSKEGMADEWHLVHLGSRAVGGAGLVIMEATAISPEGRISPQDHGIWSDDHIPMLQKITDFIKSQGAIAGLQLAHAGRKGSCRRSWEGGKQIPVADGGWVPLAPSSLRFQDEDPTLPRELTLDEIGKIKADFLSATKRTYQAGFEILELHAAHGYLLHSFLSPLSNQRHDCYGGSFENRIRLVCEIATEVRAIWPDHLPLFVRLSSTDWVEGGWTPEESVRLSKKLKTIGVDLIDCSSGGSVPKATIPIGPGYQIPFAHQIKKEAAISTAAVGMITTAEQATTILEQAEADMILIGRASLNDPYWPLHAAQTLGVKPSAPPQYGAVFSQ